jgi:hypothetical protein
LNRKEHQKTKSNESQTWNWVLMMDMYASWCSVEATLRWISPGSPSTRSHILVQRTLEQYIQQ